MLKLDHKKFKAWEKSIILIKNIYLIPKKFPKEEMFGITSQLRRAAVSVASNIAEGASRTSITERRRFYVIARSSLVEIDTQFEICLSLDYLATKDMVLIEKDMGNVFALLSTMIKTTH